MSKPKAKTSSKTKSVMTDIAYLNVIGVDVHNSVLVCSHQVCDPQTHSIITHQQSFGTKRSELNAFAQWCKELNPEIILMESTGVLWRSPYEALEDLGFTNKQLVLVNAREVKGALGRKTDREDADRLARFARLGQFKPSFVPAREFRDMRTVARLYIRTRQTLADFTNRYHKMLNSIGCRASQVFSDIKGKTAQLILDAYVTESSDWQELAKKKRGRLRATADEIIDALNFVASDSTKRTIQGIHRTMHHLNEECDQLMENLRQLQQPYEEVISRLLSIPGIKEVSARLILAEISNDLSHFPDSEHFCSWLGVCPGNNESAGKAKKAKVPKGNRWLRITLTEIANGIALSKTDALFERFQVFKERRGKNRAIVAIAHLICRIIYSLFKSGKSYEVQTSGRLKQHRLNKLARDLLQARQMNLIVTDSVVIEETTGEIIQLPKQRLR